MRNGHASLLTVISVLAFAPSAFAQAATGQACANSVARMSPIEGSNAGTDICFNPREYSVEKSIEWKAGHSADDAPLPSFKEPLQATLNVEFAIEGGDSNQDAAAFKQALQDLGKLESVDPTLRRPPLVEFAFAGQSPHRGVVSHIKIRYTKFLRNGTPTRAIVQIEMIETDAAGVSDATPPCP